MGRLCDIKQHSVQAIEEDLLRLFLEDFLWGEREGFAVSVKIDVNWKCDSKKWRY